MAPGDLVHEPLPEFFRRGERALADLLVAGQVEKGMLKDRADHPHQVHFGRPGQSEDLPGGARRDETRISVDDIHLAARRHRIVQQAFGLAGDQRAHGGEVDRGHGGVQLRPFGYHPQAAIETEHERAVHLIDADAVDGRNLKIEIAAKNILHVVPAARDRKSEDHDDVSPGRRRLGRNALRPRLQNQRTERTTAAARGHRGLRLRARRIVGLEHELSCAASTQLFNKGFELAGERVESG